MSRPLPSAPRGGGPAPRWKVGAAIVLLLLATTAVLGGIDALRLPDGSPDPDRPLEAGDPREQVECAGRTPSEGTTRDPTTAPAQQVEVEVTSGALLACPESFDGRRVIYRGEVVGQTLGRGPRVWVQVNDDAYAMEIGPLPLHRFYLGLNGGLGVNLSRDDAAAVRWRGGPGVIGDQVEVRGTFHRVEPATGEMAVVRAESLEVLSPGRRFRPPTLRDRQVAAYALVVLTGALLLLQRRRPRF